MPTDTELLVLWKANAEAWKVACLAQQGATGEAELAGAISDRTKESAEASLAQAWRTDKKVREIEHDWPRQQGEPNA